MPQNNQTLLEKTVADQWQTLPSGLTVLVRPMPGYSSTHVIYATKFGSIDRDFCLNGQTVHLPAGVAHFLEHKMFEDQDGDAFAKYAKTGANSAAPIQSPEQARNALRAVTKDEVRDILRCLTLSVSYLLTKEEPTHA